MYVKRNLRRKASKVRAQLHGAEVSELASDVLDALFGLPGLDGGSRSVCGSSLCAFSVAIAAPWPAVVARHDRRASAFSGL